MEYTIEEIHKNILREYRVKLLQAFDIVKTNVLFGIDKITEEEKDELLNWYYGILNLNEACFCYIDLPKIIKKYYMK